MKTLTRNLALVLLAGGVGAAALPAAADMSKMMSMDANKDGMLSKAEVQNDKKMTKKFDDMDANSDGMIDKTEMSMKDGSGRMGTPGGMNDSSNMGGSTGAGTPDSGMSGGSSAPTP